MKIATHDSATGEKSKNLLHSLFKFFAQTQDKTIKEQYEAGVRYFDFRIDKDLVLCHGLWKSDKTLVAILAEMRKYVDDITYITVTIERKYDDAVCEELIKKIRNLINLHGKKVKLVHVAKKKPSWTILKEYRHISVVYGYISVPTLKQYLTRPFKDWRRYVPIPKFLKKITPKKEFSDEYYVMIDFV